MSNFIFSLLEKLGVGNEFSPLISWDDLNNQKVYVVDTNLFFECRILEELTWSDLEDDNIVILVTQYVLDEIERNKKSRETSRTKKRAIAISSKLRPLIVGQETELTIKKENPRVLLRLETLLKPTQKIEKMLDLSIMDNKIVGCVDALLSKGLDASILSHDGNALSTANSMSLPAIVIPDHWLLPPQDDNETRENKKLQKEIERLRKKEPEIRIVFLDNEGEAIQRAKFDQKKYIPLTETEIAELIRRLETEIPIVSDFGSEATTPKPELPAALSRPRITIFEHATAKRIDEYRKEKYPEWLSRCREYLASLHSKLHQMEQAASLSIEIENVGTRPAKSTLIEFEAKGGFAIRPKKKNGAEEKLGDKLALPLPPKPPAGQWRHEKQGFMSSSDRLKQMMGRDPLYGLASSKYESPLTPLLGPRAHDPDGFYWKNGRPSVPEEYCSLTCDNWRHAIESRLFTFEIYPELGAKNASGALECKIHAENMTDPKKLTVPVAFLTREIHIFQIAESLVDELSSKQN